MNLKKKLEKIEFENIIHSSAGNVKKILDIRNEYNVRMNMFSKNIISSTEHKAWLDSLKKSDKDKFYCIKFDTEVIGGLGLKNYNKNLLTAEWAFYISQKKNFIGLGALIEFKALEFFFSIFNIKKLICLVLKSNAEVIKLHYKFGFINFSELNYFNNRNLNFNINEIKALFLEKKHWKKIYKKFYEKFKID